MKRKLGITAGILVLVFLSRPVSAVPSFHVPGTLVLDRIFGTYNAIIEEGYYFLVFVRSTALFYLCWCV